MRIFLIGMPGSGKSYWGKQLAQQLNYPLLDLDVEIMRYTKQSIEEIFAHGEYTFRLKEHEVLKDILAFPTNAIIACGGGTPCFFNNLYLLLAKGTVVYLQASSSLLTERLWDEKKSRPLISSVNKPEELADRLKALLEKREAYYLQAHHIINVDDDERSRTFEALLNIAQM